MPYIPHSDVERQQMLAAIGVPTIEDLFEAVPARYRFPSLDLPAPASEMEIMAELTALAEANDHTGDMAIFRGAGAYHHFVPSVVNHILMRGEFYTAYTPYQPEMSQGTLQAIFEYQTMIAQLTGMDGANASHYDGATALAEAVTVAREQTRYKKSKILLSPFIHPQYREVVRTYHQGRGLIITGDESDYDAGQLAGWIDDDTAMVAVGYPNFLGQIEVTKSLIARARERGALVVMVANPLALALLKSPGELGADIVVGEGQPLGIPLSYGGPYLGYFATKSQYIRKIAGRIVGETVDKHGKRAFVMTLRPREQDIRRDKATSNICTNQGLMALAATVYLSLMGKNGLKRVAELNYHKAHYAADQIEALPGFSVDRARAFFNEFVIKCPIRPATINSRLSERGFIGGYELDRDYPFLPNRMLVAVTEMNTKAEIDAFVQALSEVST